MLDSAYGKLGLQLPGILLPSSEVDLHAWATIACDQHTSNQAYWEEVERIVDRNPSTLRLVLPEAYLDHPDKEQRLQDIRRSMEQYVADGTLQQHGPMAVYVERESPAGTRRGLMLAIDLDAYDYNPDARTMIRATESTILERIPPRVAIRKGAPVELPHIMMLLDDQEKTVIEPLGSEIDRGKPLYETDLMIGGGRVRGYAVDSSQQLETLQKRLTALLDPERLMSRYGSTEPLLLAVGDGNHSLAAAKSVWEELKANGADRESHPGRYALVEIVNLFDDALHFHPIHRVVFGVDETTFPTELARQLGGTRMELPEGKGGEKPVTVCANRVRQEGGIGIFTGEEAFTIQPDPNDSELPAVRVQQVLDSYSGEHGASLQVDYIHEVETVSELCKERGNVGIFLPELEPSFLFPRIAERGPLPRKIFSMGTPEEKRYYLEARKIL